jgi:hypothetical protein
VKCQSRVQSRSRITSSLGPCPGALSCCDWNYSGPDRSINI